MKPFKTLMPRCNAWYRWHTSPTSMFDSGSNKFVKPAMLALGSAVFVGAGCISSSYFLLAPLVLLAALLGGAVGDLDYWFVLAGDIRVERQLSARLEAIDKAVSESEEIVNRHAPTMESARCYFKHVRAKLAQLDQLWYDQGIGVWVRRAEETAGSEMAVLVNILNKVHRQLQPDWKNLEVVHADERHSQCGHPQFDVKSQWCSYCYEAVYRKLAEPLVQASSAQA